MNPDYKEIGKNIRLMRIRHGISQSELASGWMFRRRI